jgi:DNA-binding FrmR family transcriptional regulator
LHFKKIIFIDNDLNQIESVKKACNKLGVNFIGMHYTECEVNPFAKTKLSNGKFAI